MTEEKSFLAGEGAGERFLPSRTGSGARRGPPEEVIYDNGQILLELLRGRSEEEAQRRSVAGLRRGPDDTLAPENP